MNAAMEFQAIVVQATNDAMRNGVAPVIVAGMLDQIKSDIQYNLREKQKAAPKIFLAGPGDIPPMPPRNGGGQ